MRIAGTQGVVQADPRGAVQDSRSPISFEAHADCTSADCC
jgi:hypothetical protein